MNLKEKMRLPNPAVELKIYEKKSLVRVSAAEQCNKEQDETRCQQPEITDALTCLSPQQKDWINKE